MKKYSPENERIKRRYFAYLKEARRQSEQTVDGVAKALARFEEYTSYKAFKSYHHQQAVAFKNHLASQRGQSGKPLSKATLHSTLSSLKRFFQWLSDQSGYKSRLKYCDADYFNLSEKDVRVATAKRGQKSPTLEQIKHVIANMPASTEVERRNRALMAFTVLTGARDSAIASMQLRHIDLIEGSIYQDARDVKTKFSKSFVTYFFPVGKDIHNIVEEWVKYLIGEKLWGNDDPLFPSTLVKIGSSRQFEVVGLDRKRWSSASPIRTIFRQAFEGAGLPYFNPHSFRNTLVRLGEKVCKSPEDFKAWSQNMGHEQVLTTFISYGEVDCRRQGEIIKHLGAPQEENIDDTSTLVRAVIQQMRASGELV